jgi:cyclic-di-GMP phosphodiesterase TipF (flagellum assembly factor)
MSPQHGTVASLRITHATKVYQFMVSAGYTQDAPVYLESRRKYTTCDIFVCCAISLVAMAIGLGLVAQLGFDAWLGATAATVVFVTTVAGHVSLRRAEAIPAEQADVPPARDYVAATPARDVTAKRAALDAAKLPSAPLASASGASANAADRAPVAQNKRNVSNPSYSAASASPAHSALLTDDENIAQIKDKMMLSQLQADDPAIQDLNLGNFRPRTPAKLETKPSTPLPIEDSGNIDDMIRRLADDIEAGRQSITDPALALSPILTHAAASEGGISAATSSSSAVAAPENLVPNANVAPPPLPTAALLPPGPLQAAPMVVSPAVDVPITELKKTKPPTMTQAAQQLYDSHSVPPSTPTAKLAAIADALSDEQMDVFLETINGLDDYRAQHYEVSVRLRTASGEVLDNSAFIAQTRGTGLLPLIEAVKVSSTKRLAIQMVRRGRTGEFFSGIDGEALNDEQFSEDIDTITGGDQALAARLVLAFSQADVRTLTPAQLKSLTAIKSLGFRFSIESITDLNMDFNELSKIGFAFAKLDAEVFLQGLPTGTMRVPPSDICRYLAKSGLSVIVGKISDEAARAKILGFGAPLAQGALFGVPRPIRADILKPAEQRPAAL